MMHWIPAFAGITDCGIIAFIKFLTEAFMQQSATTPRSLWSSRFAFIMVTAGAAVGLGNIWKFPYMAGHNGGGIFVITYLICTLLVGIPAMIAELLIGRHGRQNAVNTLETLSIQGGHSRAWKGTGWLGA